jgi:hypothetical protein
MTLRLLIASWTVLTAALIALFLYRRQVGRREDDFVHLSAVDAQVLNEQASMAQRLDTLDRWMKILLIVVVAFGLLVAAAYVYSVWNMNPEM